MNKVAVVNIVGLSKRILEHKPPFLTKWASERNIATIDPLLPAVTCSVQSTYLTGKAPSCHGIVANGWYFKEECEVKLWRQSNKLVQAPSIWENARKIDKDFTCANMFWWYNMYSSVDYAVTPRPQYRANGLKIPDCYSSPAILRDELQDELGTFPLFNFWGPMASIKSSEWIAEASKKVFDKHQPDLTLVYLPHLDYCLQKYGHNHPDLVKEIIDIDRVAGDLIRHFESKGVEVNVISEYGITDVDQPIHINRILRELGMISIRVENDRELLDAGRSKAFAMADHQIAHVYVNDPEVMSTVRQAIERVPGIAVILNGETKRDHGLEHERSGDLILIAEPRSWFTYYFWLDDDRAPDYARMVDIHSKPGYDPVEMFLDPEKPLIKPKVALKVLGKKLGFRTVLDVIPLDANLIKGSHGQIDLLEDDKAIFISSAPASNLQATDIHDIVLGQVFGEIR